MFLLTYFLTHTHSLTHSDSDVQQCSVDVLIRHVQINHADNARDLMMTYGSSCCMCR